MTFDTDVVIEFVFGEIPAVEGMDRVSSLGFDGVEILQWEEQDLDGIVRKRDETGLDIVSITAYGSGNVMLDEGPSLVNPEHAEVVVDDLERSIDVAERIDCPNLILTVGPDLETVPRSEQRRNAVDVLRAVAADAEAAGVTLLVEPLNTAVDWPGYFLASSREGYEIVDAVDSPNVRLLFDVYHQQITEGNIINNMERYMDGIGHVHVADVPGRRKLGTGELHFENILQWVADSDYEGYVGVEFTSRERPEDELRESKRFLP